MKLSTFVSIASLAGLAAAPVPAAAQVQPAAFKPSGAWSLDYGEDYCRLARNFSSGADAVSVAFERIEPGPLMRLILVSSAIKPYRSAQELGWHFTPTDAERKTRYTVSATGDGTPLYTIAPVTVAPFAPPAPGTPPAAYDRAKEQSAAKAFAGLVIDSGLTSPIQVETGDMAAPIAALQACADDLAKSWGLDPAKLQNQKSPALPDGGGVGWLPTGTIPFSDFGKLGGAANQVRLLVDATGKPTACAIHSATLDKLVNDKICAALMANAKFTPAKDATGQPMAGYWVASPMQMMPPFRGGRGR
jgi:hypothetical protein